ncbi:2-octaprenyl-6-methoxyphenyl hydroxylase [Acidithiobacillus marinus]|uniref:2-octaprenyl-6-methoxyphenyl hydroxylase n=1 Tax=Acidithiobacillus marinus TaxID=187490 RepID=A0A2I1DLF0_9PROT|nr:FAD-dependent monooxygenase [Acidithiobacillus marinus]PKY10684.1 2-octaprenyl-6-methoxyphenyl hydroxylase [Acidithiobacillus marinus]
MSADPHYDLIISGAGMVGASLALAVQQTGLRVAVFEKRPQAICALPDKYERASLVAAGSGRFLQTIGIDVATLGSAVERMRVWDAETTGSIHLDAEEAGESFLGHIVENRRLEQLLHAALAEQGVAVFFGQEISTAWADQEHMHISTSSTSRESSYGTTLLAIAEGRQSLLRKQLIQAPVFQEAYGQDAITATVWMEKPHRGIAYQRFLPTGPLAVLPFSPDSAGHPRASIVWSAKHALARRLMQMDDAAFLAAFHQAFGPQLGHFVRIGERNSYPLSGLHSSRYTGDRCVVLGDSAHGVHPLAGLGVNLGFRDVTALAQSIQEARARHEDWGDRPALHRYQRARRPDNLVNVMTCGALSHLFSNRSRGLARLRDLGMLGTGLLPPVKRFLIRQAMGL